MTYAPDLLLPLLVMERCEELRQVPHPEGSLYAVMVGRIQAAWPGRWNELQAALSAGQFERVAALAHTLMGTTASLGLARLSACLRAMEGAARHSDASLVHGCARVVDDLYADSIGACLQAVAN